MPAASAKQSGWALLLGMYRDPFSPLASVRKTEWPEKCSDGWDENGFGRRVPLDSSKSEEFGQGFVGLKLG